MNQLYASIKKEILLFKRTGRLIAAVLVLLGLAFLDTAQIPAMKAMGRSYDEMLKQLPQGTGISESFSMTELMDMQYGENPVISTGVTLFAADIGSTALIVTLILFITVAGSEQKKRATIIPSCTGLKTSNYLLAKFIVYPITVFFAVIIATMFSFFVSSRMLAPDGLTFERVILCGVFNGLFLAFIVCLHLLIGLSTSRPGISATLIIIFTFFVVQLTQQTPGLMDRFNPFALYFFARYSLYFDIGSDLCPSFNMNNIFTTFAVTAVLIIASYFLTLFALNAKRVDNSGNDILI